jgi:hypothetical protein
MSTLLMRRARLSRGLFSKPVIRKQDHSIVVVGMRMEAR